MQKPKPITGMRHIALNVIQLDACVQFYRDLLGMKLEWQPDADNIYLTSGNDNLALHRAKSNTHSAEPQRLDHFGFILNDLADVDQWCEYLRAQRVVIKAEPKTHRDGARSFYCSDPDGNLVQLIYLPNLAN